MAVKSLAIKYRPSVWNDVTEQSSTVKILQNQLDTGEIKNAYLFCGGAGTGKTTCARIFANDINKGQGNPIEMDAASNNSVDDVREIIQQAKTKSLDSEYKVFIIDECHSLSNTAWQAMLKLIEEPPAKSIFIFCTTDPQKIPKTIISRVQRYEFKRISYTGIISRIRSILLSEMIEYDNSAVDYIAKLADGGMRDALTLLDKCIAYGELTLDNVVKSLGALDYDTMFKLTDYVFEKNKAGVIEVVESIYHDGLDLKQFVKQYIGFVLDLQKYHLTQNTLYTQIPQNYLKRLDSISGDYIYRCGELLDSLIKLNADIKWDTSPKAMVESVLILECEDFKNDRSN